VKLFRAIAVAFMIALLAVGARADQGGDDNNGGNGPSNSHGGGTKGQPGGPSGHEKRSARSNDGSYNLTVSGFYKGTGTASVSATAVTLTGQVKSEGGELVPLQTEALQLSGPYFSGKGTIGGAEVAISGKLDAAKVSRLTATYKTPDNHRGRIAGTLPTDTPDEKWNDDHH
jgi:hypothetical protein